MPKTPTKEAKPKTPRASKRETAYGLTIKEAQEFLRATDNNGTSSGSPLNTARGIVSKLLEAIGE